MQLLARLLSDDPSMVAPAPTAPDTRVDNGSLPANVKDYGAVGDGVADDTAAIRAAVATGRNVHFPAGSYCTESVTLGAVQCVTGDGMASTYLVNISTEAAVVFEGIGHRTLKDIGITGGAATTSHGVEFRSASAAYVTLERVRIYRVGGHGIYGGHAGNVNNANVTGCEIQGCALDGINMQYHAPGTHEMNAIWINHCNISANGRNGVTFSGNSIRITENTIQVNRGCAIALHDATPSPLGEPSNAPRPTYGSSINSNYFEGNCHSANSAASPIMLHVGTQGGSGFTRLVRGLEIANNFFNESGPKYRSLIHVGDVAGTTDMAARHSVVRTRSNFGKIRLLTWDGAHPLSAGFTIDEDASALIPADMRDALPMQVQLSGNHSRYGIGATPPHRRVITRAGTYTFNGATEAGCLIRMTNTGPASVNLHTYDTMQAGHAVAFVVTGAGAVSFPVTGGATIYGNPGPYPTGSLVTATRLSPTEWVLS